MFPKLDILVFTPCIFFLLVQPSECCLTKRTQWDPTFKATIESLTRRHPIDEPLYSKDSAAEFLEICASSKDLANMNIEKFPATPDRKSDCQHPEAKREFTDLELYYLKIAQDNLKKQLAINNSVFRIMLRFILFIIPLGMTVYLVYRGHFSRRTLPYIGYLFQSDNTDGVTYNQFIWMRYLVVSGNHPIVRHSDPDKIKWYKYNKDDEDTRTCLRKLSINNAPKFRFRDRSEVPSFITEEEIKDKKRNIVKVGWDFIADRRHIDHLTGKVEAARLSKNSTKKST